MKIVLRKARDEDLGKLVEVESKATPGLQYIPNVFDAFIADEIGEFSVAEVEGEIVACGKFTVVPDGSAWLETIRVLPEYQGLGIGKRFYERFYDTAHRQGVTTMRMYTGVKNAASKGLAERYGFQPVGIYRGALLPCQSAADRDFRVEFQKVTEPEKGVALLMPFHEKWKGFLVMNRTFFALTPALCADLTDNGMVYEAPDSQSVITIGARFMPETALHIGVFGGDTDACLGFALQTGKELGVGRMSCYFPQSAGDIQQLLTQNGYQIEASDFYVMEADIG